MMLKLKQAKTSAAAAVPASNIQIQKETTTVPAPVVQTLKTWSPSKPFSYNANRVKDDDYEEDEYYEDDYEYEETDDEDLKKLSPLGIDPPQTRNRMQTSSSLFRKFAQDNVGSNFRRPEPKDETAKKANAIFKKYSSLGSTPTDSKDNNRENEAPVSSTGKRPNFSDLYKKKYGSRKSSYTVSPDATST